MFRFRLSFLSWFGAFFRARHDLELEFAALRQPVCVLKRKNPRPGLDRYDRLFWLALRRVNTRKNPLQESETGGTGSACETRVC